MHINKTAALFLIAAKVYKKNDVGKHTRPSIEILISNKFALRYIYNIQCGLLDNLDATDKPKVIKRAARFPVQWL